MLASLVWGALCTVAVGWYFAFTAKAGYSPKIGNGILYVATRTTSQICDEWDIRFIDRHPVFQGAAMAIQYPENRGYMQRRYRSPFDPTSTDPKDIAMSSKIPETTISLCGWPWLALEAEESVPNLLSGLPQVSTIKGGFSVAIPYGHVNPTRAIPWWPVWPGFLADTAIFAVPILPIVSIAFSRLTRNRRLRRGLSPRCKYPIGSSPNCSECGNSLAAN